MKKLVFCCCSGGMALVSSALAFAQESGLTVGMDSALSDLDIAGGLADLGGMLATGIAAALGIAIGAWGIMLVWKKIRGAIK